MSSDTTTDGPLYSGLPLLDGTDYRHAWKVFGPDDERGTLNWISPGKVADASRNVRSGEVVPLGQSADAMTASLMPSRSRYVHEVLADRGGRDDRIDGFFLQGASHWDSLSHVRHGKQGFYGGRHDESIDHGSLGIDRVFPAGLVTRGVLVDVVASRRRRRCPIDFDRRDCIGVAEVEDVLAEQGDVLEPGDALIVRTGWLEWFNQRTERDPNALAGVLKPGPEGLATPGLQPSEAMAAFLWDKRVAAVAADNPAVEALPVVKEEGFLHRRVLAAFGMPFGELWRLDGLAEASERVNRTTFLLISVPMLVPRGAGSPSNALAIF